MKQAFEQYARGVHTKKQVLEQVTAAGLRTQHGKRVSKKTFDQLLRKPVYAGWIQVDCWHERVSGDFEPLISQEIFNTVQALLSGKRVSVTPRLRSNPDFPLRHFVKCGCCGKPLTGSWSKGRSKLYANYCCQNAQCRGVNIRKEVLEHGFVEFLERAAKAGIRQVVQ
ncbi:MAG TPA: recombinase family protein [Pseudomonadales bacterium]|nr:recombinase family protein [Pseudomonadales bacterium]